MHWCNRWLMLSSMITLPLFWCNQQSDNQQCDIRELSESDIVVGPKTTHWLQSSPLDLYVFHGFENNIARMFTDVYLYINLTNEETYQVYQGDNCSDVKQNFYTDQRLWGLVRQVKLLRSKQLDPFKETVIGISTVRSYKCKVRIWNVNYMRAALFIGAIVLYLMSHSLVRNALFYYTSGCTIGIIASLLIIGFIVYRLAPRGIIGLPIAFGGWSLSLYMIYMAWKNLTPLVLRYQKYVAAYFVTIILISFAICYRYGPPTDIRSHNLAQWALQLIALLLIYYSNQVPDVSFSVIVILLLWSFSKEWILAIISRTIHILTVLRKFLFPECRRLLTEEEFRRQGEEETRKALEQLSQYCRSPVADAWKLTSALKDPKRMASFVSGTSDHVTEEESLLYDEECSEIDESSDDSDDIEYIISRRPEIRRNLLNRDASISMRLNATDTGLHQHERDDDSDSDSSLEPEWESHSLNSKFPRSSSGVRSPIVTSNGANTPGTSARVPRNE